MAEFVQTMKNWRRMCIAASDGPDTTKCDNCPMGESRLCSFEISDIDDHELQEAETFITTWAAEHPEPVYPTWFEWLESVGVAGMLPDDEPYYGGTKRDPIYLNRAAYTPKAFEAIPADIAEKLGIEPQGVSNEAE